MRAQPSGHDVARIIGTIANAHASAHYGKILPDRMRAILSLGLEQLVVPANLCRVEALGKIGWIVTMEWQSGAQDNVVRLVAPYDNGVIECANVHACGRELSVPFRDGRPIPFQEWSLVHQGMVARPVWPR